MHTLLALLLFVVVFVVPNQVIAEDNAKPNFDKRQVSVLARDGHLPYEGKRYIGQKEPEDKTAVKSWRNENGEADPSVYLVTNKRYVGALAKSGDLRFKQQDDKREDVDTLIEELLTAEELRRIRLEALREELLKQQDDEEDMEKRSLSSLARAGGMTGKRGIASMARAGYLRSPATFFTEGFDKKGISSLARNGLLPTKRGGISSLMRNGYSHQKRSFDSEFDNQLLDEEDVDDKRNIGSLARGFTLPSAGKRNIAAFARNGWLQNIGPNAKKSSDDGWDTLDEYKRNIQALLKNRVSPFAEGKRYLGAFVANNRLPYSRANFDDSKRNIGAMARTWNLPQYGKRSWDDGDRELLDKLYLSSLLREGSLPFPPETLETFDSDSFNIGNDEIDDDLDEEKRHIGSFMAHKSFAMRKKKSITPEDQFGEQPPTKSPTLKSQSDENKMDNEIQQNHRPKREAFADFATDEYPMPVMQNTDVSEYEDGNSRSNIEEQSSTRKKRYFGALARNGWLPSNHYYKGAVSKRHIGALARLGWLPSFRSARAYSRFGRDTRSPCKRDSPSPTLSEGRWEDTGRPSAARWAVSLQQPQLWPAQALESDGGEEEEDEEVEDPVKRYLLIPALDNILLRRQPINWIH